MGRRKIEIKAIKDDRNRSVTFLKRKGGLFKKAHELSVLCSVDVAVIIFGHNKKLYEFSSGNMNETLGRYQYYGQPHEHKGPADFSGKGGLDDDDDEDVSGNEEMSQNHNMIPPQMQNQPTFQHINHQPSASPPMPNGFHPRHGTPQPVLSRPSSRNNLQRMGSALVPQQQHHHATPPPPQNGYAYMQNPPMYNPQPNPSMPPQAPRPGQYPYPPPMQHQPPPHPPQQQHPPPQPPPQPQHHPHHPQQHPPPPPAPQQQPHQPPPQPTQHHTPQPHPQSLPQAQHQFIQEQQRRQSVPPAFPRPERQVQSHERSPPQKHQQQPPSKPEQHETPPPPKPLPSKSRSIFTPIDDRGSVLAQHFGFGPQSDSPKNESSKSDQEHPDSNNHSAPLPPPPPVRSATLPAPPQRNHSLSSIPEVTPVSRSSSLQVGAKRPRLKVQIPSENSDAGSATAESSPRESTGNTAATPARGSSDTGHSGVVLPPPSPSASALLSAGAQGPPNPFARPPPPVSSSQNNPAYSGSNNNIDTPIFALPSRFVSDTLLPSPSSFYPEWGFGRSGPDSNVLPSPLTFPTPVVQNGPGFSNSKDAEESEKKRKSPESGNSAHPENAAGKRLKVE
ncbi:hypothetical protein AJ79_02746 [Helicocarpus griseus UAMH5409]|uniref:MADS-box domain-containing protein n=1 Tax=Helicocarpus griseus UAMH5409 TaxID=1447875 RepID=A0A2B7XSZ2_9EURO|nr:hypothetical protein AJ79_02746 [Helicocarpus griseus UAMH5409]